MMSQAKISAYMVKLRASKHGKVLVEAIAAGIEPLEFRRKVENTLRFVS